MKISSPFLFFTLAFLFLSCEKEIVFKGETSSPRLVLNGIVELDSTFKVNLERSVFFLDNSEPSQQAITQGATVVVKNVSTNMTYMLSQSTLGSMYEFPFVVTPNTHYTIEVTHPDFKTISSEVKTLSGVQIVSLDTTSVMQEFDSLLKFELVWNDNANEENYYFIQVVQTQVWEDQEYTYPVSLTSRDQAVDQTQGSDGSANQGIYLLVSDATFQGNQKNLKFECYNPFYLGGEETTLKIEIISMSKEVYLYRKSMSLFLEQDFFSEPVKVFTNILNGFGIFGFMSRDVRVL